MPDIRFSTIIEPSKDCKIDVTDFYTSKITEALCITVSGEIRNEMGSIKAISGFDIRVEYLTKSEEDNWPR